MDDEMRMIIEAALPFAIPVSIQLMLFVIFSNYSTDLTKYALSTRTVFLEFITVPKVFLVPSILTCDQQTVIILH